MITVTLYIVFSSAEWTKQSLTWGESKGTRELVSIIQGPQEENRFYIHVSYLNLVEKICVCMY